MTQNPILVPEDLYKALRINGTSRSRGFVEDYLDGAHDLYVMMTHKGLLKESALSPAKQEQKGWISVEERLPERDKPFDMYTTCIVFSFIGRDVAMFNHVTQKWNYDAEITHWQHCPPAPANNH